MKRWRTKTVASKAFLWGFGILLVALLTIASQVGMVEAWLGWTGDSRSIALAQPQPDPLTMQPWWQEDVKYQANVVTQDRVYDHCLFGDSISSGLGNTFGDRSFNFALSGMSSVSLLTQLNRLVAANVECRQVILAMGTNDAVYQISNTMFVNNMKVAISLVRQLQAKQIILLPVFYSTVAASKLAGVAGSLDRVEEINILLSQVAATQKVALTAAGLQPLYNGQSLRENLTLDGVHLNAEGKKIYRRAVLQLMYGLPQG